MSLTKKYCLKRKKDFEKILKKGKTLKDDSLLLKTLPNFLDENRFGFIVGKKISNKSVLRNKVKRRIKEIVRLKIKDLKKGNDVIFIALPGIEKKDFNEFKKIIFSLLEKAGLL